MSITTELTAIADVRRQANATLEARRLLQDFRNVTNETVARIQALIDGGTFADVPTDTKNTLLAAYNAVTAAQTALADAAIAEALDWSAEG